MQEGLDRHSAVKPSTIVSQAALDTIIQESSCQVAQNYVLTVCAESVFEF